MSSQVKEKLLVHPLIKLAPKLFLELPVLIRFVPKVIGNQHCCDIGVGILMMRNGDEHAFSFRRNLIWNGLLKRWLSSEIS